MPKTKREVNNDFITFSKRLRELRESLDMTQKEFADYVGFTQATLSAYENSLKIPSLDIVMKIASKCKISIDWLCGLSETKNREGELSTYGDIIKLLIQISNNCALKQATVSEDSGVPDEEDPFGQRTISNYYSAFYFKEQDLNLFLEEWDKIRKIHESKTIDDEVYDLWCEKTIKKYNKYTGKYFSENIFEIMKNDENNKNDTSE